MKKKSVWFYLIGGIMLCLVLTLLAYFYLDYTTSRAMPTIPLVSITGTYPEGTVSADQSVVVFGQAGDPDGIAEVQLWVNGEMVTSQTNPEQGSIATFDVSQSWIPTGAGNYLVLLRALDRKGSAGQSDPVRIEAGERAYSYEVIEGDTVESIAEQLDTTPEELSERNPGIGDAPVPGTAMDVPGLPAGEDTAEEDTPRVDPPPAPPPPSGEETPAEPASPPWWTFLPLPENFACLFNPTLCSTSPEGEEPASPPIDVSAELYDDACKVLVTWQDRADNEVGFRVYRTSLGSRRPDMITVLRPAPGNGERLSIVDENMPNGRFFYAVTAYNASGEYWSPPSEWVTATCHTEATDTISLSVEALEMTVRDPYERLYCYFSLAGLPFERVPSDSSFIEQESGIWDIAGHFSGENKRTVLNNPSTPLDLIAECLGWQGETLVNLGRFSRSHPPEEWDGSTLTAGPSDGSFYVSYRINLPEPGGYGGGGGPLVDPSFAPPYDLRATDTWRQCEESGERVRCNDISEPGLTWRYDLRAGERHTFRVYARRADEIMPRLSFESFRGFTSAPQSTEDCHTTVYYSVSAVVRVDPTTGVPIESPASEELEVGPSCSQVEVTLISLRSLHAQDHFTCNIFECHYWDEAYGWLSFNGKTIYWNNHCDPGFGGGCLTSGPNVTNIQEASAPIPWQNEYLNTGSGIGINNNVFRVPIRDGQSLYVQFKFMDHDDLDDDDFWCGSEWGRSSVRVLESRSPAAWQLIDQDFVLADNEMNSSGRKTCEITFHVRGLP